jgi:hypothetical protein
MKKPNKKEEADLVLAQSILLKIAYYDEYRNPLLEQLKPVLERLKQLPDNKFDKKTAKSMQLLFDGLKITRKKGLYTSYKDLATELCARLFGESKIREELKEAFSSHRISDKIELI